MTRAEEILAEQKRQKDEAYKREHEDDVAKQHEAEVSKRAVDAGYDPADPIGAFHKAVDAFNAERAQFNLDLQNLENAKARFQDEVISNQSKLKATEDAIAAKGKELAAKYAEITAKTQELTDIQSAIQVLGKEIAAKKTELADINDKITLALKKCRTLVLRAEQKSDFYYNLAMSDQWGKFLDYAKRLFRGELNRGQ